MFLSIYRPTYVAIHVSMYLNREQNVNDNNTKVLPCSREDKGVRQAQTISPAESSGEKEIWVVAIALKYIMCILNSFSISLQWTQFVDTDITHKIHR
jgi:hypothetical protein